MYSETHPLRLLQLRTFSYTPFYSEHVGTQDGGFYGGLRTDSEHTQDILLSARWRLLCTLSTHTLPLRLL